MVVIIKYNWQVLTYINLWTYLKYIQLNNMNINRHITMGDKMYICTWHSVFIQYNQYWHDSWVFSEAFCSRRPDVSGIFSLIQRPWRACYRPSGPWPPRWWWFSKLTLVVCSGVSMLIFTRQCVCGERHTVAMRFRICCGCRIFWCRNGVSSKWPGLGSICVSTWRRYFVRVPPCPPYAIGSIILDLYF